MQSKKVNYILLFAGILMMIASILNYEMNADEVSLGIFIFAGIGFIFWGIKDAFDGRKRVRYKRLAVSFYSLAMIVFLYWLAVGRLHLL